MDMRSFLYDAINDDQSHFVHSEEVLESWRIVDDLLCTGDSCPIRTVPYIYPPGNWGPSHKVNQVLNGIIQDEKRRRGKEKNRTDEYLHPHEDEPDPTRGNYNFPQMLCLFVTMFVLFTQMN